MTEPQRAICHEPFYKGRATADLTGIEVKLSGKSKSFDDSTIGDGNVEVTADRS